MRGENMETEKLKLTSSEIGSLWGEYVNGTAVDVVNRYMYSIIEDEAIKAVFYNALKTFEKQKTQIITFFENEGFPVPIGFNESDLYLGKQRLFSDAFCLNYLHIMTLHGLLGHITTLSISVRKDLRDFYDSCDNDAKKMYHQTIEYCLIKDFFKETHYFMQMITLNIFQAMISKMAFLERAELLLQQKSLVFLLTSKKVFWLKLFLLDSAR